MFLVFIGSTSFGQSLFFENLSTTTWTNQWINSESEIINKSKIGLSKLNHSMDSITENLSLWNFREGILIISNYDYVAKSEQLIAKFKFDSIYDQGILQITFGGNEQTVYDIVKTSSGDYALLNCKKKKEANFISRIDLSKATKDGIYLNGYVVNIPYYELIKLNGKKVYISGKVKVIKGLRNSRDFLTEQGRRGNSSHILKPTIKT